MCRLVSGAEFPGRTPSAAEWRLAESLLPAEPRIAARWSVGMMELGALVCTAARPRCAECPLADGCSWLNAGRPRAAQRPVGQRYEGTDRQCRGRLLAVLRNAEGPITGSHLEAAWPVPIQRARALDGLVADGLVDARPDGEYALPS
jgi:A/G-specific adenine glycosylase